MKSTFSFIKDNALLRMTIAVVAGVLLVVGTAGASTTISTNILTGGTLGALGVSTFGATASTTISAAGLLVTPGATVNGTLGVIGVASFGATATSTFTAAGVLTLQNGETISNATDNTIAITSTNVTFSGLASSTTFKVGDDNVSTVSGMIFGTCTASLTVTASSSAYANCTGATGVTSSYKVFVEATSSLPTRLNIVAASSTATSGTINLLVSNSGIDGGNVTASVNTLNFWAVR